MYIYKCKTNPCGETCIIYLPAVEVCSLLPVELTPDSAAVLSGTKSLEAIIDQLGILFMEVFMSHDI